MKSKQWYADRGVSLILLLMHLPLTLSSGIPFRRGYLLYGAPGSGKTSIIHSLAGELGLDIYIISLSKTGLDDNTLNSLIVSLPEHCIAIMEDIDAAFTHGLTRDTELEDPRNRDPRRRGRHGSGDDFDDYQEKGGRSPSEAKDSRITLSGLLNALDGVSAQEGRLLFATTNRYHSLDPALIRPGRMDVHIEFRLASQYQAKELYKRFYFPAASEEVDDEASTDSGYGTPTMDGSDPIGPDEPLKYSGTLAAYPVRAPKLSKKKVEWLAEQFGARIPEREFSMASLQGYLMSYKTRPFRAVDDIERWVEDTYGGQDRRVAADKA